MLQQMNSLIKKMNLSTHFIHFTNINLKWIIDLNVKCKTIKLLHGENLGDPGFGDDFLATTPKA